MSRQYVDNQDWPTGRPVDVNRLYRVLAQTPKYFRTAMQSLREVEIPGRRREPVEPVFSLQATVNELHEHYGLSTELIAQICDHPMLVVEVTAETVQGWLGDKRYGFNRYCHEAVLVKTLETIRALRHCFGAGKDLEEFCKPQSLLGNDSIASLLHNGEDARLDSLIKLLRQHSTAAAA